MSKKTKHLSKKGAFSQYVGLAPFRTQGPFQIGSRLPGNDHIHPALRSARKNDPEPESEIGQPRNPFGTDDQSKLAVVRTMLDGLVPLKVFELVSALEEGRLDWSDIERRARIAAQVIASHGDTFLFPSEASAKAWKQIAAIGPDGCPPASDTDPKPHPQGFSSVSAAIIYGVAVGALMPGGVTIYGNHYEHPNSEQLWKEMNNV